MQLLKYSNTLKSEGPQRTRRKRHENKHPFMLYLKAVLNLEKPKRCISMLLKLQLLILKANIFKYKISLIKILLNKNFNLRDKTSSNVNNKSCKKFKTVT